MFSLFSKVNATKKYKIKHVGKRNYLALYAWHKKKRREKYDKTIDYGEVDIKIGIFFSI